MDKETYTQAMDEITMPEALRERILAQQTPGSKRKKKSPLWKGIVAAAACIALVVGILPLATANYGAKSADKTEESGYVGKYSKTEDLSYEEMTTEAASPTADVTAVSTRKIIKNAEVYVETKDLDGFLTAVNQHLDKLGGYTESLQADNYGSSTASLTVRVPADTLDDFLDTLETFSVVQSKSVARSDVTDAYADTEGKITALETEEKALLKILETCETVEDTMHVQERLAAVRGELNGCRAQKKNYDSAIAYSTVTISVSEEARIVKHDGSFMGWGCGTKYTPTYIAPAHTETPVLSCNYSQVTVRGTIYWK